jgi:hypothetical protein
LLFEKERLVKNKKAPDKEIIWGFFKEI